MNWIGEALAGRRAFNRMPFLIIDKDNNQICGSTSYGNISFYDKRIEIGWSWLGIDFMGTGVNRNAKFALLSHAFEAMQMERVEVKTDYLNERARAALLKIGMYEEGVLRSHMQMHSNRRRDTVYYSIIRDEWLAVKKRFFPDLA
jgi:RimJ/RimL family protein N-acetyltransferase